VIFTASGLEVVALAGDYFKLAGQGPLIEMVCYSAQPDRLDLGAYYVALRPPFKNGEMPIGFYTLLLMSSGPTEPTIGILAVRPCCPEK
jgi:hypothetical protein